MLTDRALLLVVLVALLAASACRVERFDRAGCQCLKELTGPRTFADELRLRRCVASKGDGGPAALTELQCRSWLTSPWLSEPPRDDVAGRVVPSVDWPWTHEARGEMGPPEVPFIPWHEDLPDRWHVQGPLWHYGDGQEPEVPAELAVACTGSTADWNRPEFRHPIVAVLVQVARRELSPSRRGDVEEAGLPLHIIVNRDGSLEMATVGRRWWTVPPVAPSNLPSPLADELPRVDVAAVLSEVRWLKTLTPRVFARISAEGDTPWRDVWAVLWAVDEEVVADRSTRYQASGSLLGHGADPDVPHHATCRPCCWPDTRCRIMLTYVEDFHQVRNCRTEPTGARANSSYSH